MERPGPKSRAILPVPVPNLTKKSRGRRVPTRLPSDDAIDEQKERRSFICKVESCGKCFYRGEHLKRHIRSIHTHEKREFFSYRPQCSRIYLRNPKAFKCLHPLCDKHFNRHDNLLQHLKVHKELTVRESTYLEDTEIELRQKTSPPLSPIQPPLPSQSYYPTNDDYESTTQHARMNTIYQQPTFRTYSTSYGSTSETTRFAMAVSSLRTELPHSPPTALTQHEIPTQHRATYEV